MLLPNCLLLSTLIYKKQHVFATDSHVSPVTKSDETRLDENLRANYHERNSVSRQYFSYLFFASSYFLKAFVTSLIFFLLLTNQISLQLVGTKF